MLDPFTTVASAIALVNTLFKIFRSISRWLKQRANDIWREDHRFLKIVRDYFNRNDHGDERIPDHISYIIEYLRDKRQYKWLELPEARAAKVEAATTTRYREVGYTTEIEDGDLSDSPEGGSPEDGSPEGGSPEEGGPEYDSSDYDSDSD